MMCFVVKVRERGGKMRQIFLLHGGGQKTAGEGCSYASLCHLCAECPLSFTIYIRCGFRQGGSRGEAVSGPAPGPAGNAKSGVERSRYPTPPDFSERTQ